MSSYSLLQKTLTGTDWQEDGQEHLQQHQNIYKNRQRLNELRETKYRVLMTIMNRRQVKWMKIIN